MKSLLLKKFIRWPSTIVMKNMRRDLRIFTTFLTLWGPWMAHTNNCASLACGRLLQPQGFSFHTLVGCGLCQIFILGFWYMLGGIYAWCELVGEITYREVLRGKKTNAIRFDGRCRLPLSSVDVGFVQGPQRRFDKWRVPLELRAELHANVHWTCLRNA